MSGPPPGGMITMSQVPDWFASKLNPKMWKRQTWESSSWSSVASPWSLMILTVPLFPLLLVPLLPLLLEPPEAPLELLSSDFFSEPFVWVLVSVFASVFALPLLSVLTSLLVSVLTSLLVSVLASPFVLVLVSPLTSSFAFTSAPAFASAFTSVLAFSLLFESASASDFELTCSLFFSLPLSPFSLPPSFAI